MSSHKMGARSGAEGNTRLLKAYGGGSKGPRQSYATGGLVGNPSLDEGLSAAGDTDISDKPSRSPKSMKDKKEAKTNINIIIAGKDGPGAVAPPAPPVPTGAAGMAPPMPPMPPVPPAQPEPPIPMRASGGTVKAPTTKGLLAEKGFQGGAGGSLGRLEKMKAYGKKK